MRTLLALLLVVSIIPVSIITMIYGWGLTPENWGWISFGYLWVLIAPLASKFME